MRFEDDHQVNRVSSCNRPMQACLKGNAPVRKVRHELLEVAVRVHSEHRRVHPFWCQDAKRRIAWHPPDPEVNVVLPQFHSGLRAEKELGAQQLLADLAYSLPRLGRLSPATVAVAKCCHDDIETARPFAVGADHDAGVTTFATPHGNFSNGNKFGNDAI
jgi:hypothetical protein